MQTCAPVQTGDWIASIASPVMCSWYPSTSSAAALGCWLGSSSAASPMPSSVGGQSEGKPCAACWFCPCPTQTSSPTSSGYPAKVQQMGGMHAHMSVSLKRKILSVCWAVLWLVELKEHGNAWLQGTFCQHLPCSPPPHEPPPLPFPPTSLPSPRAHDASQMLYGSTTTSSMYFKSH